MKRRIRILYAEDNAEDAGLTRRRFAEADPDVEFEVTPTGQDCMARLESSRHDLLLLRHRLPDMEGVDVLQSLVHADVHIAVILVTGVGDEEVVIKALRLGAADYVVKAGDYLKHLPDAAFRIIAERRRRQDESAFYPVTCRVLYVEHDALGIESTLRHLSESAPHFKIDVVHTCAGALQRLAESPTYDLLLVELRMPDMSALEFAHEARRIGLKLPPFLVLTETGNDGAAIASLKLGAADYVSKSDGYLERLATTMDSAIAHDRLERLNGRLRAEIAERRRSAAILEDARERLERAVSAGNVGLWDWDLATKKVRCSESFLRQIGYEVGEVTDDFDDWRARIHPDDVDAAMQAVERHLSESDQGWRIEYRLRHKDGSYRDCLAQGSKVFGPDGRPTRAHGTNVDVTEIRQLQSRLLQAQKLAVVGQLAGGIAHDFNNLLTVMIGTADLALLNLRDGHPLRAEFQHILDAGERGSRLTSQLLAFSRRQVLLPQVVLLSSLIEGLHGMLQRLLPENINLVIVTEEHLGSVRADPGQLEQVVLNLVVNARDAMPAGGPLTIETHNVVLDQAYVREHPPATPGPHVMMSVGDAGVGIEPENMAQIFEPCFTTKVIGKGTGLGLATVQGIIAQSGGTIAVRSEKGRGTKIEVLLPRVAAAPRLVTPVAPVAAAACNETILVAEDEAGVRNAVQRVLESVGYEVLVAGSGEEALHLLGVYDGPVHLVISDVIMPGLGGSALGRRIKELCPETRILYTSGYADEAIAREGLFDNSNFIRKPYSIAELKQKVREVLDA